MSAQMPELNASVVGQEAVGDDAAVVRIRPDSGVLPRFLPGQHITLGGMHNGVLMLRPYSIASAPHDDAIEIYTQRPPAGRVHLAEHAAGHLTLEHVPADRDLLMVATGTGISPFMSMFRAYAGTGRWRSYTLVHGVRRVADLAYRQQLEKADLRYVPVVSREPWDGARGRVQSVLDLDKTDRERTHAFLCGSGAMVAELQQYLSGAGFAHVHMERY